MLCWVYKPNGRQCMQWPIILITPNETISIQALSYKTNITEGAKQVVAEAMEIVGGHSFYKDNKLERLFRDVQASEFHPLPKWDQYVFTGERLLK